MQRPLPLLLAALGGASVAAQSSCPVKGTVNINICYDFYSPGKVAGSLDPTALNAPNWDCSGGALRPGLIVPFAVSIHNLIEKPGSNPNTRLWATSKIVSGGSVQVRFACSDAVKGAEFCGGSAYTNVFTFQSYDSNGAAVVNEFTPSAGGGTITINADVDLDGNQEIYLGTVYTRVTSTAELDLSADPEFHARGDSSEDFLVNTQTDVCLASEDGITGTNIGTFVIPSPPPPPPPNCCTDANRNCLARCSQCVGTGAVAMDATGTSCNAYCDSSCATYPTVDSKQCFARCSQCAKGTHTVDAEGGDCAACANCAVYDSCMKAGVCTVGCVAGRRKRKLLFAPIPVCEPCCMPIV